MAKGNFSKLVDSEVPVLVDFYAEWCGPCQTMAPVLTELASEQAGKLKIIKIDTDKNQAVAQAMGVRGIPAFKLFKKGNILWEGSGAMTKQQLLSAIQPHLA